VRIEEQILAGLLNNEAYARNVIPFLDAAYFQDKHEKVILDEIVSFFGKYSAPVSKDILKVQLSNRADLTEGAFETSCGLVEALPAEAVNVDWLTENTEKFCKQKSVYNAVLKSISIIEGNDANLTQDAIPGLMTEALSVSFDTAVGHSYMGDAEARWEFYNKQEKKIPFRTKMMNKISQGGMANKSLIAVAAESGGGKSIFLCDTAAATVAQGRDVLYITLEMAEERIAERIDANLMRVDINKLGEMSKDEFSTKVSNIQAKTHGRLFIKEYPTGSAHAGHFRALLEELKLKQKFEPELILIDYLGICASSRIKMGGSVNSYSYLKAVAEELRGLAVEYDVPVLTAVQLNRSGFSSSDVDMTSIADSMGLVMTLDMLFALIRTEELDEQGTIMVKQLKNRYSDPGQDKRFLLGLDRPKMTFFSVDDGDQTLLQEAVNKTYAPRGKPNQDAAPDIATIRAKPIDTSGFKF